MDLKQRKLNRSEWESIEIPVSQSEIEILELIIKGYHDVTIKINNNNSLFTFLKIEFSDKMEDYIYNRYLRKRGDCIEIKLKEIYSEYCLMNLDINIKPKSIDKLRLDRFDDETIKNKSGDIYEFILLEQMENLLLYSQSKNIKKTHYHYYTLYKLIRNHIIRLNRHLKTLVNIVLDKFIDLIDKSVVIENAVDFIEKNTNLLKYNDLVLYEHQKEIFTLIKNPCPKLILYMAPTGTGKTMTPIALAEQKKIIFVCAARHVGLALARAAISVNKKIAFAFGCSSAEEIRLHYFAAKEYTKNKRSGGIGKVDNSIGDNVEIIICDIKSYLPAMYYMLAFFKNCDIVTYWDEPTITMDCNNHEFHEIIKKNWKDNIISTFVLSSATLPKKNELTETISDFINKFKNAEICNIVSHDCKKTIPIINKDGFVVLPHYLSNNYTNILQIAKHCSEYLTLLRYFDLTEVVDFITFVNKNNYTSNRMNLDRHFEDLNSINMKNIKVYYVELLLNINPSYWTLIYKIFENKRRPRIFENNDVNANGTRLKKIHSIGGNCINNGNTKLSGEPLLKLASHQVVTPNDILGTSGVYITTKDAYTLTDGPTIFISNDINKIANFCVQQANIPTIVMDDIMKKIEYNNIINEQIHTLETELNACEECIEQKVKNEVKNNYGGSQCIGRNKTNKDPKKLSKNIPDEIISKSQLGKLNERINSLRSMIKNASLNDTFIPNKKHHLDKWYSNEDGIQINNSFTSSIEEQTVSDIMALNGIDNLWKVLLMMGIGVFINHNNITYTEIMKKMADEQKLYMIIATSDYIWGTNYQFCHGFIGKDMDLTQEKLIQAMGRIGRCNIQQTYTVRFRDDAQINKLFTSDTEKPEVINMNILFNSAKVKYFNGEYVTITE